MRILFFVIAFQFLAYHTLVACECQPLKALTKEYCEEYDLIFSGRVDSVAPCNNKASAFFLVDELYKGKSPARIEIFFDCSSSCQMTLVKGEQWIIYANYSKYAMPEISFCSRSRKKFQNDSLDYFTATHQLSFDKEQEQLKKMLGILDILQEKEAVSYQRELIKPTGNTLIWLVVISICVLGTLLYFSKALKK